MSEKRFVCIDIGYGDDWYITDNGKRLSEMEIVDLLNEQQGTIDEQKILIEEREVANERLNRFIIETGLEKEYIKWEFKKRLCEDE